MMTRDNSLCRFLSAPAEELLIRAAMEGRRDATESLLAELLPRVRSRVRYTFQGDAEVDDITQEALVAILRGLPSYRGDGAFVCWADRVVERVAFAASRRARAERRQVDAETEEALAEEPVEERSPEDCVLRRQLEKLLERLSDGQRRALLLHHVMGMSVPELAEALEVPFETVRTRLRTGRAHLREMLSQDVG